MKNIMEQIGDTLLEKHVKLEIAYDKKHYDYYMYMTPAAYEDLLSHIKGYYVPSTDTKMTYDLDEVTALKFMGYTLHVKVDPSVNTIDGFSIIERGFKYDKAEV